MKKAVLLICLTLWLMGNSAMAEEAHIHEAHNVYYVVTDGYLYQSNDNLILQIDPVTGKTMERHELHGLISGFDVREGILYVAITEENDISLLKQNNSGWEKLFSIRQGNISQMEVLNKAIAILHQPSMQELENGQFEGKLQLFDFEGNLLQNPFDRVLSLSSSEDLLFVSLSQLNQQATGVFAYDTELREKQKLYSFESAAFYVTNDGKQAFYISGNKLYSTDKEQATRVITQVNSTGSTKHIIGVIDDKLVYTDDDGYHLIDFESIQASEKTLTLVNCGQLNDWRLSNAIDLFSQKNPDVTIRMLDMDESQLITALLAYDSELDIVYIDSESMKRFDGAGVLNDLSDSTEIVSSLSSWVTVDALISSGQRLLCVPSYIVMDVMQSKIDSDEMQIAVSWDEILSTVPDQRHPSVLYDNMYYPSMVAQFISANIEDDDFTFSDDGFIDAITKYKELVNAGLIEDMYGEGDADKAIYSIGFAVGPSTQEFTPFPISVDMQDYVPAYVIGMGVNKNSANEKLVQDFLAFYLSIENQITEYGFGYIPQIDMYPYASQLSACDLDRVGQYYTYMNNLKPKWIMPEFAAFIQESLRQFYADQISIEELIIMLDEKMAMIIQG